jgi:5-methylcytosine-specific restriction endonuclease McrA
LQMRYDELTVDHVIPLSVGGTNWLKNLQPLCSSCNSSKHTKHIDYRTNWAIPEWRILGYIKES